MNLGAATRRLSCILDQSSQYDTEAAARDLVKVLVQAGRQIADEDVGRNHEMAKHGAEWVVKQPSAQRVGAVNVLTVCNTGSLATSVSTCRRNVETVSQFLCFCV